MLTEVMFAVNAKALDQMSSEIGEDLGAKFMDWASKVASEASRKHLEVYAGRKTLLSPVYFFYAPPSRFSGTISEQLRLPLEWLDRFVAFLYKTGGSEFLHSYYYLKLHRSEEVLSYPVTESTTFKMSVEGLMSSQGLVEFEAMPVDKQIRLEAELIGNTKSKDFDARLLFTDPQNVNKVVRR